MHAIFSNMLLVTSYVYKRYKCAEVLVNKRFNNYMMFLATLKFPYFASRLINHDEVDKTTICLPPKIEEKSRKLQ